MFIRYAIIIVCCIATKLSAAEALRGPQVGWATWRMDHSQQEDQSPDQTRRNSSPEQQRHLYLDIPIPVALWLAMPFATVRYEDQLVSGNFRSDPRYGIGLLHHAAEGDPAWRLDLTRIGPWNKQPSINARYLFNLVKTMPALRLRPSDTTYSWLGVNVLKLPVSGRTLLIPEIAWSRIGTDGLAIDILAPQHIYLGYRGRVFGVMAGVQQLYRLWQFNDRRTTDDGVFETRAKLSTFFAFATEFSGSYLVTTSVLEEINSRPANTSNHPDLPNRHQRGLELSVQWIPNA